MASAVGVPCVSCAAGKVYTKYTESVKGVAGSGLLVAWVVALGFKFMGIG